MKSGVRCPGLGVGLAPAYIVLNTGLRNKSFTVSSRRHSGDSAKAFCEMTLVGIANPHGNFRQRSRSRNQELLRCLDSYGAYVLQWRHPQQLTKPPVELSRRNGRQGCHVCHRNWLGVVLLDVSSHRDQVLQAVCQFVRPVNPVHRANDADDLGSSVEQWYHGFNIPARFRATMQHQSYLSGFWQPAVDHALFIRHLRFGQSRRINSRAVLPTISLSSSTPRLYRNG